MRFQNSTRLHTCPRLWPPLRRRHPHRGQGPTSLAGEACGVPGPAFEGTRAYQGEFNLLMSGYRLLWSMVPTLGWFILLGLLCSPAKTLLTVQAPQIRKSIILQPWGPRTGMYLKRTIERFRPAWPTEPFTTARSHLRRCWHAMLHSPMLSTILASRDSVTLEEASGFSCAQPLQSSLCKLDFRQIWAGSIYQQSRSTPRPYLKRKNPNKSTQHSASTSAQAVRSCLSKASHWRRASANNGFMPRLLRKP